MQYIYHVTLNSGHSAQQPRTAVRDSVMAGIAEMLDGLLQGARLPIPGCPGYIVNASHHGHDLIATVWRGPWETRVPILTTATALKSRSARSFWELMHDQSTVPLATSRDHVPDAPWQADRVEVGAALHRDAMQWTGDFSRCLAWAWLEYREGRA